MKHALRKRQARGPGALRAQRLASEPVRRGRVRGSAWSMPELPEVEHAARSLRAWLDGRTILRARAADNRIFRGGSPRDFEQLLAGRRLERVDRRGKYLLLTFDGGLGLLSHLGMTGKWVRRTPRPSSGRRTVPLHSHARLELDDESALHYVDPRLFGQLTLAREGAVAELPVIRAPGPTPSSTASTRPGSTPSSPGALGP